MSRLIAVHKQVKLGTACVRRKLDPATAWNVPDVSSPRPSVSDESIQSQVINPAEPCFITNKVSPANKQVLWVGDIRGQDLTDEDMREVMREFLKWQGLINLDFAFNHYSNIVNLDPNLHRAMTQFDMFAVTCSHSTLDKLIEIVRNENRVALDRQKYGNYIRNLQIMPSTDTVEYEIVVLQPKHLLPPETFLTRYPTQDNPEQTAKQYQVDSHGVLREVPAKEDSPRFPSFSFASNSPRQQQGKGRLNPYVVILAAELKFREYKANPNAPQLDAQYESLIAKTFELVELLHWEPVIGDLFTYIFHDSPRLLAAASEGTSDSIATERETHNDRKYDSTDEESSDEDSITETEGSRDPSRPDIYWDGLYPGRDLPLTSDDRAFLREMERSTGHNTTNKKSSKAGRPNPKDLVGRIIKLEQQLAQERREHEEQLTRERREHAEKVAANRALIEELTRKIETMEVQAQPCISDRESSYKNLASLSVNTSQGSIP